MPFNARTRMLYEETKTSTEGSRWNEIDVRLRRWMTPVSDEVTMTCVVITDGKRYHTIEAFEGEDVTNAEFQRMAIERFDQLVAEHPYLGDEEEESGEGVEDPEDGDLPF